MPNPSLQASKWLSFQLLLDPVEMSALLDVLEPIFFYKVGLPVILGEEKRNREDFLEAYQQYCTSLSMQKIPDPVFFKKEFSNALTADKNDLFFKELEGGRTIGTIISPVLVMQLNNLSYSQEDETFRAMVHGLNTITWGVQISFPQLYQDRQSGQVLESFKEGLSNAQKFKKIRRFVQDETVPASFVVEGKSVQATVRIGKKAQAWVNEHPQLRQRNIQVRSQDKS